MTAFPVRHGYGTAGLLAALLLVAGCAEQTARPSATAGNTQASGSRTAGCDFADVRQRLKWMEGREFAGTWVFADDPALNGPVTARFGSVGGEPAIMWASSGIDRQLKEPKPYKLLMDNQGVFLFQTPNGPHIMQLGSDCVLRVRQDARQGQVNIELRSS